MVGVVGSSPIAPTKFGRKIKHLAETSGAFFLPVPKKYQKAGVGMTLYGPIGAVDHQDQATSTGWKNRRTSRAPSESRPKASCPSTYWLMLPGNTATKNSPTARPSRARCRCTSSSATPIAISTTPDRITTRSLSRPTQSGTCAWKSVRANVRCPIPATTSAPASTIRATVRRRIPPGCPLPAPLSMPTTSTSWVLGPSGRDRTHTTRRAGARSAR